MSTDYINYLRDLNNCLQRSGVSLPLDLEGGYSSVYRSVSTLNEILYFNRVLSICGSNYKIDTLINSDQVLYTTILKNQIFNDFDNSLRGFQANLYSQDADILNKSAGDIEEETPLRRFEKFRDSDDGVRSVSMAEGFIQGLGLVSSPPDDEDVLLVEDEYTIESEPDADDIDESEYELGSDEYIDEEEHESSENSDDEYSVESDEEYELSSDEYADDEYSVESDEEYDIITDSDDEDDEYTDEDFDLDSYDEDDEYTDEDYDIITDSDDVDGEYTDEDFDLDSYDEDSDGEYTEEGYDDEYTDEDDEYTDEDFDIGVEDLSSKEGYSDEDDEYTDEDFDLGYSSDVESNSLDQDSGVGSFDFDFSTNNQLGIGSSVNGTYSGEKVGNSNQNDAQFEDILADSVVKIVDIGSSIVKNWVKKV